LASGGIVPLVATYRVLLDVVSQSQDRWEAVAELDDAEGGDDADEAEEVGDTSGNDLEGDVSFRWSNSEWKHEWVVRFKNEGVHLGHVSETELNPKLMIW
jgi:hypothetical protein